ncbi:hypothetical protein [Phytomonospora endophytica]|uniref:Putative membrane protein n=1 Tax=Phytomonospora endophytica TaxID=714109 RepID=A0A841FLR1_9ACTN|nr:hypothetical protein [Phytomonospora endophytica]MBB6036915.1 putative membrane protein [Phytomonospora endophytica]GIG68053.1 membrane protein [Phytomonospora endophytica]
MQNVLLSLHVLAGIVFVGGSAVATSLFPRYAPVVEPAEGSPRSLAVAKALHRVTGGYAVAGISVPVIGIALATIQGRMGEIWITVAMALTALAGLLLATQIYPRQREALAEPGDERPLKRLSMLAGAYNLVWAAVVVLMIVRPGSGYSPEA